MAESKNRNLTVRLTTSEYEMLQTVAKIQRRSMANLIKMVTVQYLEEYLKTKGQRVEQDKDCVGS